MLAVPRGTIATLRSLTLSVALAGLAVVACSSDPAPAAATCDSSKCAPGNQCLPLNGETKCRKTCTSNADPATSCPFGYTCVDTLTGTPPFCVQDTAVNTEGRPLVKKATGQWGFPCPAPDGLTNPACDTDQGFYCYGISPTDPNSYCTRYGCEKDSDCGAGFWCAKVNQTPNVQTAKAKTIGQVENVCLRRTYCSTCTVDLDCPPIAGRSQRCIPDDSGTTFCAPECDTNQACPNEARCADAGLDVKVCYPRAKVCVGDGSLCSPCRVDTDCGEDGACVKGQYTTEKTCAKKSTKSCGNEDKLDKSGCPAKVEGGSNAEVNCLGNFFDEVPIDYCHGVYFLGTGQRASPDIGCYTPDRD